MSRKIHRPTWRSDGNRRRSPRILAVENCGDKQRQLRTRIKRSKFDDHDDDHHAAPLFGSKLTKQVWKGRDSQQTHEHHSTNDYVEWRTSSQLSHEMSSVNKHNDDGAITNGKSSTMPAKHILELVLDTLQRRDSYEIFAEPVDPDEVEDYYEIIKEPMDFGTMRAKLHEGMYENLQQFEHDVFLIPENAMHFNSTATVYFRQARAIHELAKKVFHVLKTNPEDFVLEFSGTRRRSIRKALRSHEAKDSRRFCVSKISGSDVSSSKGTLMHSSVLADQNRSTSIKKKKENPTNFLTGGRRVSSSSCEGGTDRRFTYWASRSFTSLYNKINDHYVGYATCQQQLLMNRSGDIRYKDSLMSFVKDLGPVAQMVANGKFMSLESKYYEMNSAANQASDVDYNSSIIDTGQTSLHGIIDLTEEDGHDQNICIDIVKNINKRKKLSDRTKPVSNKYFQGQGLNNVDDQRQQEEGGKRKSCSTSEMIITSGGGGGGGSGSINSVCRRELNPSANNNTNYSNFKDDAADDDGVRMRLRLPVILALENSHSNFAAEFNKSRDKRSSVNCSVSASPWSATPMTLETQKEEPIYEKPCMLLNSQFTFDIPFLKARLDQMKGSRDQ